jgi:hypothetical protein
MYFQRGTCFHQETIKEVGREINNWNPKLVIKHFETEVFLINALKSEFILYISGQYKGENFYWWK